MLELGVSVGIRIRVMVRARDAYGTKRLGKKTLGYEMSGIHLMGLKPNSLDLPFFSALTLLVGSFDLLKTRPRYDL